MGREEENVFDFIIHVIHGLTWKIYEKNLVANYCAISCAPHSCDSGELVSEHRNTSQEEKTHGKDPLGTLFGWY
jgi:hypothetical protein